MVTLTLLEQWSGCNAVGQTQKSCISHSQPGTEDLGPFLPSSLEEETVLMRGCSLSLSAPRPVPGVCNQTTLPVLS